jgi:hypothetical protein
VVRPPALSQACSNPHHGPTALAASTPGVAEGLWRRGLPGGAVLADSRSARNSLLLTLICPSGSFYLLEIVLRSSLARRAGVEHSQLLRPLHTSRFDLSPPRAGPVFAQEAKRGRLAQSDGAPE